jgi:predicted nucleotidyltransferase
LLAKRGLDFIQKTAERFGAKRVLLFGSVIDKSLQEANDIDIAVEGLDSLSAYDFMLELFEAPELGEKPVDVIRVESDVPILPIILDESVEIYNVRDTVLSR